MTPELTIWALTLLLVLLRLAGIFLLAPIFSHAAVPIKLRLLIAMVIALAVTARMGQPLPLPTDTAQLLAVAAGELLIGAAIGYAARLIFVGVEIGAFHVSQQMGLALGEVFNPFAGETSGVIRGVFGILAVALFLLIGGHRAFLDAVLTTFRLLPAGSGIDDGAVLKMVVAAIGASFVLALKVAAPVLVTMLLATVAMGMIQKTLPQSNILSTHLPVRVMIGLVVLAASLVVLEGLLAESTDMMIRRIGSFVELSG